MNEAAYLAGRVEDRFEAAQERQRRVDVKNNLAAALAVTVAEFEDGLTYHGYTAIICALHEWLDAEL